MPSFTDQELESLSKLELIAIIRSQESRITQLEEHVAVLLKNSSNSSKPPSSDIVKPPKSPSEGPRKPGGQKGHPGFWRRLFTAEKVDEIKEYRLAECPDCKAPFSSKDETEPRIQQAAELPEKLIHVTEHRRFGYVCPQCGKQLYAPWPEGVKEGEIFGLRLQSLVGYMKGATHSSYSCLQEFMNEVFKIQVSRSGLCNQISRVSESVHPPYQELGEAIAREPSVHVDETGF